MLPLFYHDSEEKSVEIVRALYKGGGRLIEYTNRGSNALKNFKTLRQLIDSELPGMELGIGTIRSVTAAEAFISAGADYIVCPVMNKQVARIVHEKGLLWIPGCMTPTEIDAAEQAGASLVKIFPGNMLGPAYISAIKEIFPDLSFMPTGGVEPTEDNLTAWFNSGVCAVGMGSKLISSGTLKDDQYEELTIRTRDVLHSVHFIRKS